MPPLAFNRRVRFEYEILETLEAGLVLKGYEVKSVKNGRAGLKGAYAVIHDGEAWLINASIPAYQPKNTPAGYDPARSRKLLLKKGELKTLIGRSKTEGLTIVPLKLYTKGGRIKLTLALARGRKRHDKREAKRKREAEQEIARALRGKQRR